MTDRGEMSARAVRCPACGASSRGGTEFYAVERIVVQDHHVVVPAPGGGVASVEIAEAGVFPSPAPGKPVMICGDCSHRWETRRKIDWIGTR